MKRPKIFTQEAETSPNVRIATVSFFLFFLTIGAVALFWLRSLPPQVPLFYSRPWGEEELASPPLLFLPPFAAITFFVANYLWATTFAKNNEFLAKILIYGGTFTTVLAAITILRILFLIS